MDNNNSSNNNSNNGNDNTTNKVPLYQYRQYLLDNNIPYTLITLYLTGQLNDDFLRVYNYRKRRRRAATKKETLRLLLCIGLEQYKTGEQYQRYIQRLQEAEKAQADVEAAAAAEKQAAEINGLFNII